MIWDVTVRRTVQPEVVNTFSTIDRITGSSPGETEVLCMCFDNHAVDAMEHVFVTAGNDKKIKVRGCVCVCVFVV